MSQPKDKKKSFNSGGGGSGGYSSPKHGGGGRGGGNNSNKSPHHGNGPQSNNMNNHHHHQNQNQQQQQQQQPNDGGLTQMKERTVYMSMSLIGQNVSVTLKNGDQYEGILSSTQTNNTTGGWGVVLRMARKKDPNNKVITTQPQPIIIIQSKDFLQLTATGVVLDHYRDSFMSRELFYTDTELSGFDGNLKERELLPWTPDPTVGESLEDIGDKKANWDQFEANEKLFGVTTSFDEDLYTTRLDRDSDFYLKNQKLAERTAYEIENEKSANIHLQEERGFIEGADYDEEERYSSVVRKVGANSNTSSPATTISTSTTTTSTTTSSVYIPPSKRGQVSKQPTNNKSTSPSSQESKESTTTTTPAIKTPIDTSAAIAAANNNNLTSPKTPTSSTSSTSSTPSAPSTPKSTTTTTNASPLNNENNGINKGESPNISKLRFVGSQTIEQEAMGSPREGLSPRSVAYTRYRQVLLSDTAKLNQLKTSGQNIGGVTSSGQPLTPHTGVAPQNETPKSPAPAIVANHGLVRALSLELATPTVPENVVNEFNNFKLKIQHQQNVDRTNETQNLKSFSNNFVMKSKSRPGSPLIGSGSPRPAPTQLSLASTTPSNTGDEKPTTSATSMAAQIKLSNALNDVIEEQKKDEQKSSDDRKSTEESKKLEVTTEESKSTTTTTTTTTTTITSEQKKEDDKKDKTESSTTTTATTTTTTSSLMKSKLKLNANAKEFVPTFNPSKLIVNKAQPESNTDSHTPINEIYFESMKKRQQQQESPQSVSSYWTDPYIRYDDDPTALPYAYPPVPHIRPMNPVPFYHHMAVPPQPMNMGVPPPHVQMGGPQPKGTLIPHHAAAGMISPQQPPMGKAIHYQPPPPGVAPPQGVRPPYITGHGQPPPPGAYFTQAPPPPFHPSYHGQIHPGNAPPHGIPQKPRYGQPGVPPQGISPPPPHYGQPGVPPPPHYGQPPIIIAQPPSPQNQMGVPPNQENTHRINYAGPTYIQRGYHPNDQF